jgi:hypothetical protein
VVAENCASRLSKEPVRPEDVSRLRLSARMEDWGHCARRTITSKDVTVSSQFESSKLQMGVDVMNNRARRKLRRTRAAVSVIETIR